MCRIRQNMTEGNGRGKEISDALWSHSVTVVTPSPTRLQLGVHPGPRWEHNQTTGGIQYMFLIPDEGEGQEVTPFIQVDNDTNYPELMATQGHGCNVHTRALCAKPNPYPHPQFTQKEEFFFQDHELFMPLVD